MRLLMKIIVQPVFIEIDTEQNVTELVSQPSTLKPQDLMTYTTELLEFSEKLKRGEMAEIQRGLVD